MDEATNELIKQHEIKTDDWIYSTKSKELYLWFDRFPRVIRRKFRKVVKNMATSNNYIEKL